MKRKQEEKPESRIAHLEKELAVKTRNLEIEAALERVRARAMAMQNSGELAELVTTLFHELSKLHFTLARCLIWIIDAETLSATTWMANPGVEAASYQMQYFDDPYYKGIIKAWKARKSKWAYELKGEEKRALDDIVLNLPALKNTPEVVKAAMRAVDKAVISFSFANFGGLQVDGTEHLSEDNIDILSRFSKVFDQTYTRFTDLKKAEEQAREAKIEAALERVRSRTMAMQKSDELAEAIQLTFEQFAVLDFNINSASFNTDFGDFGAGKGTSNWVASSKTAYTARVFTPYFDHPIFTIAVEAKENGSDDYIHNFTAEEKKQWWDHFFKNASPLPDYPREIRDSIYNAPGYYGYTAIIKTVSLTITNYQGYAYTEAEQAVVKRFGKVFEQTYTRFKDLEQAEEQAREAKIETALERVRSRTMAMQKSEELQETSSLLFQQLKELGETAIQNSIAIVNEEAGCVELSTTIHGSHLLRTLNVPINDPYLMAKAVAAWKEKRKSLTLEFEGEELTAYNELRNSFLDTKIRFPEDKWVVNINFFSKGWLSFSSNNNVPAEIIAVQQRFAAVFEQTYTRFNDLKQAEDQAREAKIETALERVRAVAMSMMRSDELLGVCESVFTQLNELGFTEIRDAQIYIRYDEQREFMNYSFSDYHGAQVVRVGYDSHPRTRRLFDAIQNTGEAFVEHDIVGEELKEWKTYLKTSVKQKLDKKLQKAKELHYYLYSIGSGALGVSMFRSISDEELNILKRFRNVFNLSYQRYSDIARAEEQAREAKIETALERVRSRTMAMFKSDELAETAVILFQQLGVLGISPDRVFIGIFMEETGEMECWATDQAGHQISTRFIGKLQQPSFAKIYTVWKAKEKSFSLVQTGKELEDYINYFSRELGLAFKPGLVHAKRVQNVAFFSNGLIGFTTADIPPPDVINLLERFAGVFNLTYTRFLDLQKAEAQAREAKIEVALERVRSRTMAMFRSDELAGTSVEVFKQLIGLGIQPNRLFIGIINDDSGDIELWATNEDGTQISTKFTGNINRNGSVKKMYAGWKAQKRSITIDMHGQELKEYFSYLKDELKVPFKLGLSQKRRVQLIAYFSQGFIGMASPEPQPETTTSLLERFAGVFNLTYTRFRDLQKAEAQAREAKIEASLERVRSKTMAMHNSHDVGETVAVMFDELVKLGVETTARLEIVIIDDTSHMEVWAASADVKGKTSMSIGRLDMTIHPILQALHTAWKNKQTMFSYPLTGEEMKAYYRAINNSPDYPSQFNLDKLPKQEAHNSFLFPEGAIFIFSLQPLPEEITQIFKKFAGVFGQTYRRYLDLQKAEAQAREAKIEASLERVRSKTMAMHNSQDVSETVAVMFDELVKLGVETTSRLGIVIIDDTSHMEVWTASADAQGKTSMRIGRLDMTIHPLFQGLHTAWKNKETVFSCPLAGEDVKAYYRTLNNSPDYPSQFNLDNLPKRQEYNSFIFPEGAIFIFSLQPLTTEITQIFKKFTGVFGQTYRRYLDLQKAETQAREAQIEASLERVRGKALAMYNSKDLSSTASLVFTELRKLGVNSKRCGVALLSKNSRHTQLYVATTTEDTDSLDLVGAIELSGHPSLEKQYESWLKNKDYFTVLKGEELKSYKELIYSMLPVPYDHSYYEEFGYYLAFSEGFLFSWAERPFTEIEINILNRFKSIIDLTFRRYIELQKSEANAREAIRQSSLDRVRAEIASMRTTGDLDRITPLIWNELTTLGVPFIRCGVFIMDEPQQLIHTYLSTPDGKAIAAFQLPFNADTGNRVGHAALQGWRQRQAVTLHWTEEEFRTFSHSLVEQGEITSEENYLTEHPPSGLDLHFFPFLQGMLYAGNTEPLSDDDKDLVQSLADAFSTAYARYEDFNRLELAKQQVEHTLSDLKSAQTKLVQSEKMASLGELTAGIAHEIQNPLNFVNNFSEVNQEMIEELEEELNAGNIAEALALAADIKQNEQKINHHGKRADGIVKGMLEHSRTGGGEKQPININALADEFMRLSYHGLRAKDKVFNAEMVTNFDPDLPKINVVGQDIGRVILNLFNNAFYAVNQKKKTAGADYRPEVSVTTAPLPPRAGGRATAVSITVRDNGIGIPDAIKEKIMQPFFTTKPTGEGTGLGLSLTYDMVVKGHGGSIQVNSVEGEGSEFIISLPIN